MIKIFHRDRCLILAEGGLQDQAGIPSEYIDYQDIKKIKKRYEAFLSDAHGGDFIWETDSENELFKNFQSLLQPIGAAGGLVLNTDRQLLMIYRLGYWDLPKGKIEKGEAIDTAALREVEEECGISQIKITRDLGVTYHAYVLKGEWVLKTTYWFEMAFSGGSVALVPQTEENITKAEWLKRAEVESAMPNSYPLIKEIITRSNLAF